MSLLARRWLPLALLLALCAGAWLLMRGIGGPGTPDDPKEEAPGTTGSARAGEKWTVIGKQGDMPGEFQQPRGITPLPDGSFAVVDRAARVQHIANDGKPLRIWTMKDHNFGNPKSILMMPNGHLLACDTHYGRLVEMTLDGAIVKYWGTTGLGNAEFVHPLAAAIDVERKRIYVAEYGMQNDRIQVFDLEGKFQYAFGTFGTTPAKFQRPSGVAVDKEGNLFVADAANHRVQVFTPSGQLIRAFGEEGRDPGQLRYPYDIAISPDQRLYIAEFNNHRISVFSRDGQFIKTLGSPGSAVGCFANPWSLTISPTGMLRVSDTGNHRVQSLQLDKN